MILNNYGLGEEITPATLLAKAYAASTPSNPVFDNDGNLWLKSVELWPSVSYFDRFHTSIHPSPQLAKIDIKEAVKRIKRLICLGIPVAINVDVDGNKYPDHWVVAYDPVGTNDFQINDPLTGKSIKLSSKYDFADKAIYGYAVWLGCPISFPNADNGGLPQEGVCMWKLSQARKGVHKDQYINEALESLINP